MKKKLLAFVFFVCFVSFGGLLINHYLTYKTFAVSDEKLKEFEAPVIQKIYYKCDLNNGLNGDLLNIGYSKHIFSTENPHVKVTGKSVESCIFESIELDSKKIKYTLQDISEQEKSTKNQIDEKALNIIKNGASLLYKELKNQVIREQNLSTWEDK